MGLRPRGLLSAVVLGAVLLISVAPASASNWTLSLQANSTGEAKAGGAFGT
jgi:hypothetical protein